MDRTKRGLPLGEVKGLPHRPTFSNGARKLQLKCPLALKWKASVPQCRCRVQFQKALARSTNKPSPCQHRNKLKSVCQLQASGGDGHSKPQTFVAAQQQRWLVKWQLPIVRTSSHVACLGVSSMPQILLGNNAWKVPTCRKALLAAVPFKSRITVCDLHNSGAALQALHVGDVSVPLKPGFSARAIPRFDLLAARCVIASLARLITGKP